MTVETFLSRNAEQWEAFRRDPMYRDLMELLRQCDPARALPQITAQDTSNYTQVLLGRIAGYNMVMNILDGLQVPIDATPLEPKYTDDQLEP